MIINVADITGQYAVLASQGLEIKQVVNGLRKGSELVYLDFRGINTTSHAFLSASIGQLKNIYVAGDIKSSVVSKMLHYSIPIFNGLPKEEPKDQIKWSYDKKYKQWYCLESYPWANDGFTIEKKEDGRYLLEFGNKFISIFKKLSTAKLVAHLLRFG